MAYGPEVKNGLPSYQAVFLHVPSQVKLQAFVFSAGSADEATLNNIFQAFVDIILDIPNTTMESAVRTTTYNSTVTGTP